MTTSSPNGHRASALRKTNPESSGAGGLAAYQNSLHSPMRTARRCQSPEGVSADGRNTPRRHNREFSRLAKRPKRGCSRWTDMMTKIADS